jgi:hypothetical protein
MTIPPLRLGNVSQDCFDPIVRNLAEGGDADVGPMAQGPEECADADVP